MFYTQPTLLNRDRHRHVRVLPNKDFFFAAKANSMFVAGVEFAEASKEYPIVFTQVTPERIVPVAVLGLRDGENLFVDAAGQWNARYVPAFVRRYPFVLAELPQQQLGVCVDEAYKGLTNTATEVSGEALFDVTGGDTPFLTGALDFLNRYQLEYMRTESFCSRLKTLGLLTEMNAKADLVDGSSFTVNGLMVVDEKKLLTIPDADALSIFRAGELAWLYAHLLSLANLNVLVDRLTVLRRAEALAATAVPTAPAPLV